MLHVFSDLLYRQAIWFARKTYFLKVFAQGYQLLMLLAP